MTTQNLLQWPQWKNPQEKRMWIRLSIQRSTMQLSERYNYCLVPFEVVTMPYVPRW